MTDKSYVVLFTGIGLAVAFFASGPLRHPKQEVVGTPLRGGSTVATKDVHGESEQASSALYAEGTISLGSDHKSVGTTLFIMAKAPGMKGAPLAVKRIENPAFPLSYSLTQQDSPFGDNFYDGDLVVTARLDQDGKVGPKQDGDVEATAEIKKGSARKADINLK